MHFTIDNFVHIWIIIHGVVFLEHSYNSTIKLRHISSDILEISFKLTAYFYTEHITFSCYYSFRHKTYLLIKPYLFQ